MVTYRSHLIAYEGRRPVLITALLGVVLLISAGFFVALPFWVAALGLGLLFRDPKRLIPPKPLAIVSPVDGTVTSVETIEDPYTQLPVVQIQLNKGYLNVMITRSPMEGKIMKQWFGGADASKATVRDIPRIAEGNVAVNIPVNPKECCDIALQRSAQTDGPNSVCRFAQWIQSDEQDNVVMAVKSAAGLLKPRCYSHSGDRIGQGQRCGIIPFHAVVQVSVPVNSRLEVKVGDHVRSGTDTLATLVH
jgi:phosphatidylserine decarboxylase